MVETVTAKPNRHKAFGILNPFGDVWSPHWFDRAEDAERYIRSFWSGVKNPPDPAAFKVVPVRVTISAIRPKASKKQTENPHAR